MASCRRHYDKKGKDWVKKKCYTPKYLTGSISELFQAKMLKFGQNDAPISTSFWQNFSILAFTVSELDPQKYFDV